MGSTDVGRHPTTSECRQGAGTSEVGGRKPVGFRPGQEVSCHGMTHPALPNNDTTAASIPRLVQSHPQHTDPPCLCSTPLSIIRLLTIATHPHTLPVPNGAPPAPRPRTILPDFTQPEYGAPTTPATTTLSPGTGTGLQPTAPTHDRPLSTNSILHSPANAATHTTLLLSSPSLRTYGSGANSSNTSGPRP